MSFSKFSKKFWDTSFFMDFWRFILVLGQYEVFLSYEKICNILLKYYKIHGIWTILIIMKWFWAFQKLQKSSEISHFSCSMDNFYSFWADIKWFGAKKKTTIFCFNFTKFIVNGQFVLILSQYKVILSISKIAKIFWAMKNLQSIVKIFQNTLKWTILKF